MTGRKNGITERGRALRPASLLACVKIFNKILTQERQKMWYGMYQ